MISQDMYLDRTNLCDHALFSLPAAQPQFPGSRLPPPAMAPPPPPPPICFPSFMRKGSIKRPTLSQQNSSTSTIKSTIPGSPDETAEKLPFSSFDSLARDEKKTATPPGSKTALNLLPGLGFGWGKVVSDGHNLSVSTFGSKNSPPSPDQTAVPTRRAARIDSTSRLNEIRALMKSEPDGGLDY